MTIILTHLLALYAIVAAPWLGRFFFEKTRRQILAGDPLAKVGLYCGIVVEQVIGTVVVLWLCFSAAISSFPEACLTLIVNDFNALVLGSLNHTEN